MTGCAIPLNFHKEVPGTATRGKWNFTRAVMVMFHDCSGYRCIGRNTPLPTTPINLMNRAVYRREEIVFGIPGARENIRTL